MSREIFRGRLIRVRVDERGYELVDHPPAVVIVLGYRNPDRSHLGPMVDRMLALGAIAPEAAAERS